MYSRALTNQISSLVKSNNPLFRPNRHRCCNGGCNFLNRPFVFSARNERETIRLCVVPSCAKTCRGEFPCAGTRLAGLFERFPGDLSVWRKAHLKFRAGGRYGGERLASKEGCLYLVWCHGFCS